MKHTILSLMTIFTLSICFSQDLTITKYEGYDCRQDSSWSGGCVNKFIYKYTLLRKNKKIRQSNCREIRLRGNFTKNGFQIIDSLTIDKKTYYSKTFDNELISSIVGYITKNEQNKLIGLDSNYFLNKNYINSHSAAEINDSMSKIKKELSLELEEFVYSSVIKKWIVELNYNGELYTFIKTEQNIFWSVYNSKSDSLLFRFFYPDWNILVNNLVNTKNKVKNDLQIIQSKKKIDIGRKILIPKKKNLKKSIITQPVES